MTKLNSADFERDATIDFPSRLGVSINVPSAAILCVEIENEKLCLADLFFLLRSARTISNIFCLSALNLHYYRHCILVEPSCLHDTMKRKAEKQQAAGTLPSPDL